MTKFTKERLEEIAELARKATYKPCAMHMTNLLAVCDSEAIEEMARQLLASMEQEPVAYYFPGGERETEQVSLPDDIDDGQKANCIPLYAAPQLPQPAVVDDDKFRADFERWMVDDEKCIVGSSDPYPSGIESRNWRAWNACRAAMLQGAEPVQGWIPCSERMPENSDAVLVCQEGGIVFCAEFDGGGFYPDEFPNVPKQGREITHWMSLPAAPQQEVKP